MDLDGIYYPVLYIPKKCITLDINCNIAENVFKDITILYPDTEGNPICIYSGYCNVKLIDTPEKDTTPGDYRVEVVSPGHEDSNSSLDCHDISQMPGISPDSPDTNEIPIPCTQSQVWIDPSTSPYVYNQYDVQQHNTYITQNVFNCNETRTEQHQDKTFQQTRYMENAEHQETIRQESNIYESNEEDHFFNHFEDIQPTRHSPDGNYFDDEFDSDSYLSEIAFAKEINAKRNKSPQLKSPRTDIKRDDLHKSKAKQQDNIAISESLSVSKSMQQNYNESSSNALKQLMSTSTPASARKTILYLGNDPSSGETIQNMSYVDPTIKCSEIEVDHEVIIENSPSTATNKKKYRCDKCQTIFSQISAYRRHVTQHNTTQSKPNYQCNECGKNIKDYNKFQRHCQGHGDPDLECPICHEVYASNASLKVHQKIHKRIPCDHCKRTYATFQTYNTHLRKAHNKFEECEECTFKTNAESHFHDHANDHMNCDKSDYIIKVPDRNDDVNNDRELRKRKRSQTDITKDVEYSDYAIKDRDHIDEENNEKSYINEDHNRSGQIDNDHVNENTKYIHDHTNDQTNDDQINEDHTEEVLNNSSDTDISESLPGDLSDDDFDKNSVFIEDDKKSENEMSFEEDEEREKIKEADSVIAKVMSNKIFLLNAKNAKKQAKKYKKKSIKLFTHFRRCQVCSKSFNRATDLKRHLIEHTVKYTLAKTVSSSQGFLDIDCEICHTETFDSIDKYKIHLREHAKLTVYKCTFCDKTFSDSSNFSKHKKIHGISHYQCDLCHRKFNTKTMIIKHMEYHNKNKPLQCKFCDRSFHFQSMLTKHMRVAHRSVTSKYKCRFCDDIFKSLKAKWDHEWAVHNIRKLIVDCEICGSKFRKFMELKRHCVEYHGIQMLSLKSWKKKRAEKMDY